MIELASGHATTKAVPAAFFDRWTDHKTWSEWSPDTEWVRLEGPARTGTRGVLKPTGGPKTKFVISACDRDREYTDTASLPGARLVFQHTAETTDQGADLHVRVTVSGPLARVWSAVMGKSFRESAQADLDRLVKIVERG